MDAGFREWISKITSAYSVFQSIVESQMSFAALASKAIKHQKCKIVLQFLGPERAVIYKAFELNVL
jgi:hypothetical protein